MKAITLDNKLRIGSPSLPVYITVQDDGGEMSCYPIKDVKLVTVHNNKGRERKAIALVMDNGYI